MYDAAMADAPDNLRDLRRDLKRALSLMDEKRDDYVTGREMYDGTRVEVAASKFIRKLIAANADAYPISLAHIPVDVIVDMIELTSLTVKDAGAARLLDIVTEANDITDQLEDWLRKAGSFGDYYAIIDPAEETAAGGIVPDSLRWIGASPLSTIVIYDEADDRVALYGARAYQRGKTWHARLYYGDCTVRLVAAKGASLEASNFELDFDEEEAEAFVFHPGGGILCKHLAIDGHPYGTPLHRKAWGPQDALTKISATNLANLEGIGLPSRWALLDSAGEVDDDIDEDFGDAGPGDNADNVDANSSRGSKIRSEPGAITFLKGITEVGTFETGDGNVFLANQDWYVRAMAVATGIPLFEFDLKGDQPSGESRRRAMARALKKAKRVRRVVGLFAESLAETTLAVLGREKQTATSTFYPIETSTDKEGIELVALKIKSGVPVRVALLEAGYPEDQVNDWWPADAPAVTIDMLTVLGSALASLGSAKTLGVITDTELADMLPTILTSARDEGPTEDADPTAASAADAGIVVDAAAQLKAKADALGSLIRSGADPEQAADMVGLDGLEFPNVPVTVRIPETEATGLEGSGAPAPAAPAAP